MCIRDRFWNMWYCVWKASHCASAVSRILRNSMWTLFALRTRSARCSQVGRSKIHTRLAASDRHAR
eukprot:2888088-Prymnesium_polylepis.3